MLPSAQKDGKIPHKNKQPKTQKQKPPALLEDYDEVHKKLMRRYTERLRRQEMATLSASLRTVLPLEYIKGKRSISDHFNEAAKYIKHLRNKIKELERKRNKLRMLSNYNVPLGDPEITRSSKATHDPPIPTNVTVSQCLGGVEVVLSSSSTSQMLPLSRILDILLEEGLHVVNCFYTKAEGRQIYTIHTQVSDLIGFDPSALQRKLAEAIPSSSNSSS